MEPISAIMPLAVTMLETKRGRAPRGPIVIVPCGARKQATRCAAGEMYTGPYFRACLAYARSIAAADDVYILSAKYGLLTLDQVIAPYELRMGQPGAVRWDRIQHQAAFLKLSRRRVVALGGIHYRNVVMQAWGIPQVKCPAALCGGIGGQMAWMKANRGKAPWRAGQFF